MTKSRFLLALCMAGAALVPPTASAKTSHAPARHSAVPKAADLPAPLQLAQATAPNVESAYAFIDQVLASGAATMGEADYPEREWFTMTASKSGECQTRITGSGKGEYISGWTSSASINWRKVIAADPVGSDLAIQGGVSMSVTADGHYSSSGSGSMPRFPIHINSEMAPRLAKAAKVIIASCAPSTGGF